MCHLTCKGVFNLRNVGKMRGVRYTEAPHAVSVAPLGEMPLEGLGALVREVAADLASVANVETVQFIQPVWDGLWKKVKV